MLVMLDERRFVLEEMRVVVSSRLMKVKLQDIVAGEVLTFIAAYQPTRDKPDATIVPICNIMNELVENVEEGTLIVGDLNAELSMDLATNGRQATTADNSMQLILDHYDWPDIGPAGATYTRNSTATRIDHILADTCVAAKVAASRNLPGLSAQDHSCVEVVITHAIDAHRTLRRPKKLRAYGN